MSVSLRPLDYADLTITMAGSHGPPYASHRARDTDTRHSYPVINHKASELKEAPYQQTKVRRYLLCNSYKVFFGKKLVVSHLLVSIAIIFSIANKILKITQEFNCFVTLEISTFVLSKNTINISAITMIKCNRNFSRSKVMQSSFYAFGQWRVAFSTIQKMCSQSVILKAAPERAAL